MNGEPEKKQRLTFDEAAALIEDVAQHGEGAQKLRALSMVMAQKSSTVTLPDPLSADEVVERLARLMRAAGVPNSQFAYRRAFPAAKKDIQESMPRVATSDIPAFHRHVLPKSLKQLYKRFPEIKRGGQPPGYPRAGGIEAQQRWCEQKALEILRTREQEKLSIVAPEARVSHAGEPDDVA